MKVCREPIQATWSLTEYGQGEHQQRTVDLPGRELIVGRTADADLTINQVGISKRHARLSFSEEHLMVEDLGSTNGTYVNGEKVQCMMVCEGDLLQFANSLYRIGRKRLSEPEDTLEEGIIPWAQTLILFDRLITERAVVPYFQPIISMDRKSTPAFELLARSQLEGLTNPALMFGAAERLGQQATLSELMREEGMLVAQNSIHSTCEFFLNTHPVEVLNDRLIDSLYDLRASFPNLKLAIEIHEAAVTDTSSMKGFRKTLGELNMRLSYDDFGAGQGRLVELGEVPPDVLKFDMALIRDIDSASSKRQELLATLVRMANDLGTIPLAEGVETVAEHAVCAEMGFQLGQGFLYGRPERFV